MNQNVKTFITIFFYICGVAGIVTVFTAMSHKPAETTTAIISGILGVVFLGLGVAMTRKRRY